jgi:hypothetical protein
LMIWWNVNIKIDGKKRTSLIGRRKKDNRREDSRIRKLRIIFK